MAQTDNKRAKLDKISWMLEHGGTMLAQHCEQCGAPMFRYKGEVLCPVCSTEKEHSVGAKAPEPSPGQGHEPAPPAQTPPAQAVQHEPVQLSEDSAAAAVKQKMDALLYSLQYEDDPRKASEILDAIRKAAEVLKALK